MKLQLAILIVLAGSVIAHSDPIASTKVSVTDFRRSSPLRQSGVRVTLESKRPAREGGLFAFEEPPQVEIELDDEDEDIDVELELDGDGDIELELDGDGDIELELNGDGDSIRLRVPGVNVDLSGSGGVEFPDLNLGITQVSLPEISIFGATVYQRGDRRVYTLSGDVLFGFDQASLRPDAVEALQQVASSLEKRHPEDALRVEGHTDSKGSNDYNQRLSEKRARAVGAWLERHSQFRPSSIRVRGYGERRPIAPNTTESGLDSPAGRQLNRRVEITVPWR